MNQSLTNIDDETRTVLQILGPAPSISEEKTTNVDLTTTDTAPPPIVSTDVTEEEADQLLAPYLPPPQEVGGSLKVVDPRKPDPPKIKIFNFFSNNFLSTILSPLLAMENLCHRRMNPEIDRLLCLTSN